MNLIVAIFFVIFLILALYFENCDQNINNFLSKIPCKNSAAKRFAQFLQENKFIYKNPSKAKKPLLS